MYLLFGNLRFSRNLLKIHRKSLCKLWVNSFYSKVQKRQKFLFNTGFENCNSRNSFLDCLFYFCLLNGNWMEYIRGNSSKESYVKLLVSSQSLILRRYMPLICFPSWKYFRFLNTGPCNLGKDKYISCMFVLYTGRVGKFLRSRMRANILLHGHVGRWR